MYGVLSNFLEQVLLVVIDLVSVLKIKLIYLFFFFIFLPLNMNKIMIKQDSYTKANESGGEAQKETMGLIDIGLPQSKN